MKNIVILFFLLAIAGVTKAQAQVLTDLIADCSKEPDSLKRLVCYDDVAEKIEKHANIAQNKKAPTPAIGISPSPPVMPTSINKAPVAEASISEKQIETRSEAVSQFGMERKIAQDRAEDKIYAQVSSITKNHYGKFSVELDNDQTWKQIDSNKIRLKVGERLYIERGVLGSFFMSKDDINRRVRVKRTK